MKKALVVGGNSGIGLAITLSLLRNGYEFVYIVGKELPKRKDIPQDLEEEFFQKTKVYQINLINSEYDLFDEITDINALIITVGFGRVCSFENLLPFEIKNLVQCNETAIIQVIKKYYNKILSNEDFFCCVMGSIAGHITSPMFSVYGASKAAICSFIENINIELIAQGKRNRILDVSPGSLKGTRFNGGENQIGQLQQLADKIVCNMHKKEMLYIPDYEEIYRDVLDRYQQNPLQFGVESYFYKQNRISLKAQGVVGYLSGTFDLFHIGHLNLLRRAKQECDYLIVGVHKSGAWKGKETFIPFEDRLEIVSNIKYVDRAVESYKEDSEAYEAFHFDKLFVGSDYKGSERFQRYEQYFLDKGVQIVYFPYTKKVSSSLLRERISNKEEQ